MKKSKILSLLLVAVMAFALVAGCGGTKAGTVTPPTTAPTTEPTTAPTTAPDAEPFSINVCIASEPQTMDPALNSSLDGATMIHHLFEGLMKWSDSGEVIEDATINRAELVNGQIKEHTKTINDNGTVTYIFTLRDDIKWSDGKAVTAGDYEYSWKRAVAPVTASDYSNMFSYIVGYKEIVDATLKADPDTLAVKALDEKTLEVTLYNDTPYFLELCAFPTYLPVRQDIIEAKGDQWAFDVNSYIGNGAYKMSEWVHSGKIVMVKNENYYDYANLGPETITFTLTDNDNAMLTGFQSGELNFIQDMPVDEIPALLATDQLKIVDYLGNYYISYQTQKAPFDDWRVRKAFTLAIDSQYIVDYVKQTGEIPANGWVPSGIADATEGSDFREVGGEIWTAPTTAEIYAANLVEANRLLDEAGFTDRSKFPAVEYLYNTSDAHKAIGEALQSQWTTGLGVQVTLKNQEWAAFLETRKNGEYQIARNGWINDYNDPMGFLDMWITDGGNNDGQYTNPKYDAAIAKAMDTADPAERMAAMHEAEDILMNQDWALGPIYFYTQKYMMTEGINNVYYTPLGFFFFQQANMG